METSGGAMPGTFQDQQHDNQQEATQQQQQQQHDLYSMLALSVARLRGTEKRVCVRALHRASRGGRSCAVGALKTLSLAPYEKGRQKALGVVSELISKGITPPPALVRAAAVAPIPWGLLGDLAAAPSLTSLSISAPQAALLLAAPPTPTAAAAPGLAASLACLRRLSVWDLDQCQEAAGLHAVGRLVGACTGTSALVLHSSQSGNGAPLLDGLEEAAAAAAAATTTAAAALTPARGSGPALGLLPNLSKLVVVGPVWGLGEALVTRPEAVQLTELRLVSDTVVSLSLAACSRLRDLHLDSFRPGVLPGVGDQDSPSQHMWSTGLTRLNIEITQQELPFVWGCTQLRHLQLFCAGITAELPSNFSCLGQLTLLSIAGNSLSELPHQMGVWLPQLQVLSVPGTHVTAIPHTLTRLTCLSTPWRLHNSLSSVEELTQLRVLRISIASDKYGVRGSVPSAEPLTRLTALRGLTLNVAGDAAVFISSSLPCLRRLSLSADHPARVMRQLVGTAQHLTFLELRALKQRPQQQQQQQQEEEQQQQQPQQHQQQVAGLGQLGALPALRELRLYGGDEVSLVAAGTWLQQQEHMTRLSLKMREPMTVGVVPQVGQLPPRLQRLSLCGTFTFDSLSGVVAQLTGLRVLKVITHSPGQQRLPEWLSRLVKLVVLRWDGDAAGCEVIAQLLLLRQVSCTGSWSREPPVPGCAVAPHLCWH